MSPRGDVVEGKFCPKCKSPIVYNGNYFCERIGDGCAWAMNTDHHSAYNKDIIATFMAQRAAEKENANE